MPTSGGQTSFQAETRNVISGVRRAYADVVSHLPVSPARTCDLHKVLHIDRKLGWKIAKVLGEEDLLLAAQHMPGVAAVQGFLDAAAARGVPTDVIATAKQAGEEFQRLVATHADQRASFDRMLLGCSPSKSEQLGLTHRKAAVAANSFIWGIRARTQLAGYFLAASADGSKVDIAGVRGFDAFRLLRPNTPWVIARVGHFHDNREESDPYRPEPLGDVDPERPDLADVPLLTEFCSKPSPKIRQVCAPDGCYEYELVDVPVGNKGAQTCVMGEVSRAVGTRYRDEDNEYAKFIARLRTPVDTFLMDLFIPANLFGPLQPELLMYSDLNSASSAGDAERQPRELMETAETVRHLGRGVATAYTPTVPGYADLVGFVFRRLRWEPTVYDHYRVRLEFPAIPTTVKVRFPLPARPS